MVTRRYASWGNYPPARQTVRPIGWRGDPLPVSPGDSTLLPYGLGRSYGDSCLNDGGTLLDTRGLDHLIQLDERDGVLRCEAGVSLAAILELLASRGWFPPVCPGTRWVTVGGAIANDIHGKNHHRVGTFGRHVVRFELLRSDGRRLVCSESENPEWFRSTIGGLGLTGVITWAEIRLKHAASEAIDVETVRFSRLDEFFDLVRASDAAFEYTVAWLDALAGAGQLGRGLFIRGNHAAAGTRRPRRGLQARVPCHAPSFLLHPTVLRAANAVHYRSHGRRVSRRTVHYERFFFPLDSIGDWNRLYGKRGLLQYQCVVPPADGPRVLRELLLRIGRSGEGSFLAVLKVFGELPSPGLLSFPRPGVTLALDFPIRGTRVFELLDQLDEVVASCGGRVYPAKDARMSAAHFQAYYPQWRAFAAHVDPAFSSSFWRRVTATGGAA
jgi:FAD/FMN-containing dehydrogenase